MSDWTPPTDEQLARFIEVTVQAEMRRAGFPGTRMPALVREGLNIPSVKQAWLRRHRELQEAVSRGESPADRSMFPTTEEEQMSNPREKIQSAREALERSDRAGVNAEELRELRAAVGAVVDLVAGEAEADGCEDEPVPLAMRVTGPLREAFDAIRAALLAGATE